MNYRLVIKTLGYILMIEAVILLVPLVVSLIYKENDWWAFILTIGLLLIVGGIMSVVKVYKKRLCARDGLVIVGIAWILIAGFGALPFWFSGGIPSFVDAYFETMSGFTTTGASILTEVESLSHGLLFWRSLTHWFGGMGVLVFTMMIMQTLDGQTQHLMRAESPGPVTSKLVPKIQNTTKILYELYIVLTLLCIVCLLGAGMPLFDSLVHAFGTTGTGGFSIKNGGIADYHSVPIEMVLTVFMLLSGVNYSIYFMMVKRQFKGILKNEELRLYIIIVFSSILIIALNIMNQYGSFWQALRYSAFQVATVITTTGYATTDFNLWPQLSRLLLVGLMFVGGCAGSTAGGFKQIRLLLAGKVYRQSAKKMIHPREVVPVKVDGKPVEKKQVTTVLLFLVTYVFIIFAASVLVSFDNYDLETTVTAVIATVSNIGPGLSMVGPTGNFSAFSDFSKIILTICMVLGRLELYPILILFMKNTWKRA